MERAYTHFTQVNVNQLQANIGGHMTYDLNLPPQRRHVQQLSRYPQSPQQFQLHMLSLRPSLTLCYLSLRSQSWQMGATTGLGKCHQSGWLDEHFRWWRIHGNCPDQYDKSHHSDHPSTHLLDLFLVTIYGQVSEDSANGGLVCCTQGAKTWSVHKYTDGAWNSRPRHHVDLLRWQMNDRSTIHPFIQSLILFLLLLLYLP